MIRVVDIVVSVIVLLLFFPLLLAIALVIVLDSGFPFYFKHKRVGKNGNFFYMYKFRTMRKNSEDDKAISLGPIDERITPIGRHIRRLKLDELLQLFNILRNQMSLVGYRPQVPYYVEKYKSLYESLLPFKPGIVSTAAIIYRNEENILAAQPDPVAYFEEILIPEKCRLDRKDMDGLTFGKYLKLLVYFFFSYFAPSTRINKLF